MRHIYKIYFSLHHFRAVLPGPPANFKHYFENEKCHLLLTFDDPDYNGASKTIKKYVVEILKDEEWLEISTLVIDNTCSHKEWRGASRSIRINNWKMIEWQELRVVAVNKEGRGEPSPRINKFALNFV